MALCLVCSLNFACNSPEVWVRLEFTSLELQRLWASLNVQVSELHAKLFGACRPSARARPRTQQSRACPRIRQQRACPPVSGSPATLHGGNCSIRAATRRRHAGRGLLMVQNPPSMTGPIRSRRRRPHPIDDGCVGVAGPQRRDMSHTRPSVPGADARCAENSPPGPIRGASGWSRITIGRLVAVGCSGTAARPPTTIERLSHDDARSPGHPL